MSRTTPGLQRVARRLLALEAAAVWPAAAQAPPAGRVCDTLRRSLCRLLGVAGFRALLARALALVSEDAHWLKAVRVTAEGSLKGVGEAEAHLSQGERAQGEVLLIAQLIGLLVTFIGADLTGRLVQEAWPELSSADLEF